MAHTSTSAVNPCFKFVNGIEHYDNGVAPAKWRCPKCKWWLFEDEPKCAICNTSRDGEKR